MAQVRATKSAKVSNHELTTVDYVRISCTVHENKGCPRRRAILHWSLLSFKRKHLASRSVFGSEASNQTGVASSVYEHTRTWGLECMHLDNVFHSMQA